MGQSSGAIKAGQAYVELFTKDNLKAGLDSAQRKLAALSATIIAMGVRLAGVGVAMAAPFGLAAREFANTGSELLLLSRRTGMSVEALSELEHASVTSGGQVGQLGRSVGAMQGFFSDAASGGEESNRMLRRMGLTFRELNGMAPEDQIARLADGLNRIPNPAQRAQASMQLFGEVLPLLNEGSAGMTRLRGEAQRLGATISGEDATAAREFSASLTSLWSGLRRIVVAVGAGVAPALRDMATWAGTVAAQVSSWVNENRGLVRGIAYATIGIAAAGVVVVALGIGVGVLSAAFGVAAIAVGVLGTVITIKFSAATGAVLLLKGAIVGMLGLLSSPLLLLGGAAAAWLTFSTRGQESMGRVRTLWASTASFITETWGGVVSAISSGDFGNALRLVVLSARILFAEWRNEGAGTWDGMTDDLADVFGQTFVGLGDMWSRITHFISGVWIDLMAGLGRGWGNFTGFFETTWARVAGTFTGDTSERIARITAEQEASIAAISAAQTAANAANLASRQRERGANEAQVAGQRAVIAGDRARRDRDREAPIEALRRDRVGVQDDIAQSAQMAAMNRARDRINARLQAAAENAPPPITGGGRGDSTRGTFDARQATGFAGGVSPEMQQVRLAEQQLAEQRRLRRAFEQFDPAVFGA